MDLGQAYIGRCYLDSTYRDMINNLRTVIIKIVLNGMRCEVMDRIRMTQDRNNWRALEIVPKKIASYN
jgi:hypothetical protein